MLTTKLTPANVLVIKSGCLVEEQHEMKSVCIWTQKPLVNVVAQQK